jgi:hypothetical protein
MGGVQGTCRMSTVAIEDLLLKPGEYVFFIPDSEILARGLCFQWS